MRYLRALAARIAGLFGRGRADQDLRDELEAHLEMETADNVRRGMAPAVARRQALLASGGVIQATEAVRDQRGLPWVENLAADIRYALRALRHSPAFTGVVVLTLALGIGANTAIYSVVRGVLLKPLPHRDGERLLYLRQSTDGPNGANVRFSVPEVRELRDGVTSLADMAEYSPWFGTLRLDDGAVRIDLALVTGNFFDILGLAPIAGRLTSPSDDGTGAPPVMVLSHDYWMKRFGGDPGIVGKQVRLESASVTVIGVVEPAPWFPDRVDALANMVVSPHHLSAQMVQDRSHRMTETIARLAPGASLAQARAEAAAVYARGQRDHPAAYDAGSHFRVAVLPFKDALGERARLTVWLLMAVAGFVMIIAVANVVNLTLMRGVRRDHEIVVRAALGAGTARLRRLLLVENLVLTGLGAALGVVIAVAGLGLLISVAERYSPRAGEIRLDLAALGFTMALSLTVALLLSFLASLPKEGSPTFASRVASGARRLSMGRAGQRLQRGMVVAQVAASVMLLAGAGLLTRTTLRLSAVGTGLQTEDVLTLPVPLLDPSKLDPASDGATKAVYDQLQREVRALPGVLEVGVGSTMPLRTSALAFDLKVEGRPPVVGEATPRADFRTASPEYFAAAGIPLLEGRPFATTDQPGSGRVVIINETLARQLFPGQSPIGKRIALGGEVLRFTPFSGDWRTVVGVVGTTQDGGLDAAPRGVVFSPFATEFTIFGGLVIRTDRNAEALAAAATRIVRRIAPTAPIADVLTVAQIKDQSVSPRRLNAALVSSFALLAVLIAAVGIGGVLAFSVSARTNEIGIRMSLGADRGRVRRMILREGGSLLAIGLAIGVVGGLLAAQVIRGLLFGVATDDPVTFAAVIAVMAAVGIGACWIPARRAAGIDPTTAMRA
ncbi:MAG: ADOP family duplicated permease [Gemmatimonadales bacterium]